MLLHCFRASGLRTLWPLSYHITLAMLLVSRSSSLDSVSREVSLGKAGAGTCFLLFSCSNLISALRFLSSHINAETPGSIHEGGELGYALSVSFGAVMDNPDLIVTCVVGDGEAETGPTATYVQFFLNSTYLPNASQSFSAWHGYKYIDPAESGAVLPIVHVNGFKISERTIYGTMDNKEMIALFTCVFLPWKRMVGFNCLR